MYTKGEWAWFEGDEPTHKELAIKDILGDVDSILYHGANWHISEANARLISAAPDLLEALEEAQSFILRSKNFDIKDSSCFHIANVMTQAINKAKGE